MQCFGLLTLHLKLDQKERGQGGHYTQLMATVISRIDHRGGNKFTFNIHNIDIDINEYDIKNEKIL